MAFVFLPTAFPLPTAATFGIAAPRHTLDAINGGAQTVIDRGAKRFKQSWTWQHASVEDSANVQSVIAALHAGPNILVAPILGRHGPLDKRALDGSIAWSTFTIPGGGGRHYLSKIKMGHFGQFLKRGDFIEVHRQLKQVTSDPVINETENAWVIDIYPNLRYVNPMAGAYGNAEGGSGPVIARGALGMWLPMSDGYDAGVTAEMFRRTESDVHIDLVEYLPREFTNFRASMPGT